jgi:hypothetical protein
MFTVIIVHNTIIINNSNPQLSKAHLTTLNINDFKRLKLCDQTFLRRGPIEWYYIRTKFHGILASGS